MIFIFKIIDDFVADELVNEPAVTSHDLRNLVEEVINCRHKFSHVIRVVDGRKVINVGSNHRAVKVVRRLSAREISLSGTIV